jgi:hydrogenase expression/formation protein HypC
MCLGVPGRVIEISQHETGMKMGRVDFGGITKEVCLECIPDIAIDEYVIVHVGFAISKVDEDEAAEVFRYLEAMGELAELNVPQPD